VCSLLSRSLQYTVHVNCLCVSCACIDVHLYLGLVFVDFFFYTKQFHVIFRTVEVVHPLFGLFIRLALNFMMCMNSGYANIINTSVESQINLYFHIATTNTEVPGSIPGHSLGFF
jgi:hypothetical protein